MVIVGVKEDADEMVGVFGPDTRLQAPVPVVGAFPLRLKVVTLHNDWLLPASDAVAGALLFKVTVRAVKALQPVTAVGVNKKL